MIFAKFFAKSNQFAYTKNLYNVTRVRVMRFLKTFFSILFICLIGLLGYYFIFLRDDIPFDQFYETEAPIEKEVKQVVFATGILKLKDLIKIGSLVKGKVKVIHVEENDFVKEGQLLVEIDTGLGDTELRIAEGAYEKALAELEYYEAAYKRKQQLFNEKFLSDADLEDARRNYLSTLADVKTLKASYEQQLLSYNNNKVFAPSSGLVVQIDVVKGEKVSSDIEGGELLSLAPDVEQIEAELEIHEKDIGQVLKGQKAAMVVDTYPNKSFETTIHHISLTSKKDGDSECVYSAKAFLNNAHLLLRSGMSVNASIDVASVDSALTVTSRAFLIKEDHLIPISKIMNVPIVALSDDEKKDVLDSDPDKNIQFVWAACDDCFQEIPVEVGISDQISFEIKSGLKGDEQLIVEVMEDDKMQEIYDQYFRKL